METRYKKKVPVRIYCTYQRDNTSLNCWQCLCTQKLPPLVPYVFPIIGNSLEYGKDHKDFIRKATEKYGSTFRIHVNGRIQVTLI